ncbi:MAG: TatD family hydrolase [Burkholderiales bacterium]
MSLVDSHCHLDFPELAGDVPAVLQDMSAHDVSHALCVSVTLEDFPRVRALAESHDNLFASVGTHPDYEHHVVPQEALVALANHPKVLAIGETGLDYYRLKGDLEWQRERFRTHIRAARETGKPLIIHTRAAAADTIRIMQEERADEIGGVMHCFTESWETAQAAIALGFHISFSGIVTFKNAAVIKAVARQVPLERLLVETDSPYLAPVPYRGKTNRPGWVRYVAEEVARLRGVSLDAIAQATTSNFFRLFRA